MSTQNVVSKARAFAARAHGARQHDTFLEHLDEVAVMVRQYGETHQAIAYLHHVVDDTDTTLESVASVFGPRIAKCVGLIALEPGDTRKVRTQQTYSKLASIGADDECAAALVVVIADRLAGLQDCCLREDRGQLRKYRQDHRNFRTATFRAGLAEDLWRELTELIAW